MTVAAAFRIEGIPAMIGDFLITDNDKKKPHMILPTRPDLNSSAFGHLERRVAGTRRKIHLFNPQFVAGFSGSLDAGSAIFAELERQFSARVPTILDLTAVLEQFNDRFSGWAFVNGWTMHSRACCFQWSAGHNACASVVTESIIGSGASHLRSLLSSANERGHSEAVTQSWDKAVLRGLTLIGGLLTEELSTGSNLEAAYGFGGEMILQTSSGFRSADKLTLLFFNIRIEIDGTVNYYASNAAAIYENRGPYTVVQITHLMASTTGLAARDTSVCAITPIHDALEALDVAGIGRLELSAPYYFAAFFVVNVKSGKSAQFKCAVKNEPGAPIRIYKAGGLDHLEIDRRMIDPLMRSML